MRFVALAGFQLQAHVACTAVVGSLGGVGTARSPSIHTPNCPQQLHSMSEMAHEGGVGGTGASLAAAAPPAGHGSPPEGSAENSSGGPSARPIGFPVCRKICMCVRHSAAQSGKCRKGGVRVALVLGLCGGGGEAAQGCKVLGGPNFTSLWWYWCCGASLSLALAQILSDAMVCLRTLRSTFCFVQKSAEVFAKMFKDSVCIPKLIQEVGWASTRVKLKDRFKDASDGLGGAFRRYFDNCQVEGGTAKKIAAIEVCASLKAYINQTEGSGRGAEGGTYKNMHTGYREKVQKKDQLKQVWHRAVQHRKNDSAAEMFYTYSFCPAPLQVQTWGHIGAVS